MKVASAMKTAAFISAMTLAVQISNAQDPPPWRALIIYTNAVDNISHTSWYENSFTPIFDYINDVYTTSSMTTRAQIAGVVWDKSYLGGSYQASLGHLRSGTGGMGKYVNLLEQYAADVIILRDTRDTSNAFSGVGGAAGMLNIAQEFNHGYMWITSGIEASDSWAHEIGHLHGLTHCDGYRKTFDAAGNYTEAAAPVSGFNDIMAYDVGNRDPANPDPFALHECQYPDGSWCRPNIPCFKTTHTNTFSSPNIHWTSPNTQAYNANVTYTIGDSAHNGVDTSNKYDDAVRAFRTTPANLTLADTMRLQHFDYANFLATSHVTLAPGFGVDRGRLSISVGPGVLAKRGIQNGEKFISDRDIAPKNMGAVSNFSANYDLGSKSMKISFNGGTASNVSLAVFDPNGILKADFGRFQVNGNRFSTTVSLAELPNGAYFMRTVVGSDKIYKQFAKR